jgi:hypothetical protein
MRPEGLGKFKNHLIENGTRDLPHTQILFGLNRFFLS